MTINELIEILQGFEWRDIDSIPKDGSFVFSLYTDGIYEIRWSENRYTEGDRGFGLECLSLAPGWEDKGGNAVDSPIAWMTEQEYQKN